MRGRARALACAAGLLLAMAGSPVSSQDTPRPDGVRGVVRDSAGEPLAGVLVEMVEQWERGSELREDVTARQTTGADGAYALRVRDRRRRYLLRFGREGYVAYETPIRLQPTGAVLDVVLPREEEVEDLPPEAVTAYNAAVQAVQEGRLQAAVPLYQEAVALAPASLAAHLGLAELLLRQRRAAEAAPVIDIAAGLAPDDTRVLRVRAEVYAELGPEAAEAAAAAREAYEARVPERRDERLLEQAERAYNRGELETAEQRLRSLLQRHPESGRALHLLALCRLYAGDATEARELLERFLATGPAAEEATAARELLEGLRDPAS